MNELVRNDVHLVERKSLHASSGETVNDPALVVFLSLSYFFLHALNHNVVVHVLEFLETLSNALSAGGFSFSSSTEHIARCNMSPLEVFGKGFGLLKAARAWWSHDEDSSNGLLSELL